MEETNVIGIQIIEVILSVHHLDAIEVRLELELLPDIGDVEAPVGVCLAALLFIVIVQGVVIVGAHLHAVFHHQSGEGLG